MDSIACKSNYRQVILCINTRSGSTIMYYFDDDEGAKRTKACVLCCALSVERMGLWNYLLTIFAKDEFFSHYFEHSTVIGRPDL